MDRMFLSPAMFIQFFLQHCSQQAKKRMEMAEHINTRSPGQPEVSPNSSFPSATVHLGHAVFTHTRVVTEGDGTTLHYLAVSKKKVLPRINGISSSPMSLAFWCMCGDYPSIPHLQKKKKHTSSDHFGPCQSLHWPCIGRSKGPHGESSSISEASGDKWPAYCEE